MRSPSTRSPLWSYSLVSQAEKLPTRAAVSSENTRSTYKRKLEQIVQTGGAVAHSEHRADLGKAPPTEPVAAGQAHIAALQARLQVAKPPGVLRIASQVAAIAVAHARVRARVDVVGVVAQRGQPAGDEGLAQSRGRLGQVGGDAQAPEALPEHAPWLGAERGADGLGIADD